MTLSPNTKSPDVSIRDGGRRAQRETTAPRPDKACPKGCVLPQNQSGLDSTQGLAQGHGIHRLRTADVEDLEFSVEPYAKSLCEAPFDCSLFDSL